MKRLTRICIASLLVFVLCFAHTLSIWADAGSGRVITIFATEGEQALHSRGDGRETAARAGQRLSAGHTLSTGVDSTIELAMDRESVLLMDSSARVAVNRAGNSLSLAVLSGAALVTAPIQNPGQSLETRAGNLVMAVRGTMFTVAHTGDAVQIVMLTGWADVNGQPLSAGYMLVAYYDAADDAAPIITPIDIARLDSFSLTAIRDNAEYILRYGAVTPQAVEEADRLLHVPDAPAVPIAHEADEIDDIVIHYPGPQPQPPDDETGDDEDTAPPQIPEEPGEPQEPEEPQGPPPGPPVGSSPDNPITITTTEQLLASLAAPGGMAMHYALANPLVTPIVEVIGSDDDPFLGSIDGNGHTITLNINRPGDTHVGMFAVIGDGALVRRLALEGAVDGSTFVGSFAGIMRENARLINVSSVATVSGSRDVGGLVGRNYGLITRSFTNTHILLRPDAVAPYTRFGGIAGMNSGSIDNSYTAGTINTQGLVANVGGIVGGQALSGIVSNTFSLSHVCGSMSVGGIAGMSGPPAATITRNIAFNRGITIDSNTNSGRVTSTATAALSNNWGHIAVSINDIPGADLPENPMNGITVTAANFQSVWDVAGFVNPEIWAFSPDRLIPVLLGTPGSQNHDTSHLVTPDPPLGGSNNDDNDNQD